MKCDAWNALLQYVLELPVHDERSNDCPEDAADYDVKNWSNMMTDASRDSYLYFLALAYLYSACAAIGHKMPSNIEVLEKLVWQAPVVLVADLEPGSNEEKIVNEVGDILEAIAAMSNESGGLAGFFFR